MYTIYSKPNCPFCDKAKNLLKMKGEEFEFLTLGVDYSREDLIEKIQSSYGVIPRTMPQILKGEEYIGGYTELEASLK